MSFMTAKMLNAIVRFSRSNSHTNWFEIKMWLQLTYKIQPETFTAIIFHKPWLFWNH